jgi:hypothetical protein
LAPTAGLVFLILGAVSAAAQAQPPERPARPGPALAVGLGNSYAGMLGLQAIYFIPRSGTRFTFSPSVSLGFSRSFFDPDITIDRGANRVVAGAASLITSYGYRHRAAADVGYSLLGQSALILHGVVTETFAVYGPHLQVGYEFVGTRGFLFRLFPLGGGYLLHTRGALEHRWVWTAALGLGWKLW